MKDSLIKNIQIAKGRILIIINIRCREEVVFVYKAGIHRRGKEIIS
jgi:hypothetical protein